MFSILEVTQRVPPTCIIKISRTALSFVPPLATFCLPAPPAMSTLLWASLRKRFKWACTWVASDSTDTTVARGYLKISQIEKSVSIDPTRPCIYTSNQNIKIHVRIHSTVNVIRARIFIMLSVREVTQRVPPTCTIQISRTSGSVQPSRSAVNTCCTTSATWACSVPWPVRCRPYCSS